MFEKITILLFISAFAVQILYYLLIYSKVFYVNKSEKQNISKAVSVIISARNESKNLQVFLPKVLKQSYQEFEVIVVNDRSDDNSNDILETLKKQFRNLSIITISSDDKNVSGKKYALTKAINNAKYEHLLFTDADCYPVSKFWIRSIMDEYTSGKEIVLGYGAYKNQAGFLNKLIRFDTLFIALQYFSFAKLGIAYMGVGRNLSYKKNKFEEYSGFSDHMHILSGDDDLHISKIADKTNTAVSINKESITVSVPKKSFKDWIIQKRRHLSTGFHYKSMHKILLALEPVSKLFFFVILIAGIINNEYIYFLIFAYIFKYIIQFVIIGLFAKRLNEKIKLIFIPIFEVLLPVLNLYIILSNSFTREKKWK